MSFSEKIDNFNLHDKSLASIMWVMQKYERIVSQKYGLTIVELVQDNDQATLPWRGTSQFEIWCNKMGIQHITPPANTHELSSSQERAGKEIITKSIKMRTGANFPEYLWPKCMDASAFLHARCPSALHGFRSPNEVLDQWFRQYFRWYEPAQIRHRTADLCPDWSGIYAYGCCAYPLIQDKAAGHRRRNFKVQSRAHIGYLVGYIGTNIYKMWVPSLDQVIVTRNLMFNKSTFYEGDPKEEMPVEQATQIADALHDGELINAAEEVDIPLPGQVLSDQNPELTTNDQTLGGGPNDEVKQEAGLPDVQTEVPEDATRDDCRPAMIRESAFLSSKILVLLPQMLLLSQSLWWRAIVVIAGKPTAMQERTYL
jgi:hypothetical protein